MIFKLNSYAGVGVKNYTKTETQDWKEYCLLDLSTLDFFQKNEIPL